MGRKQPDEKGTMAAIPRSTAPLPAMDRAQYSCTSG
ncbi:hypothetical protein VDGD_21302 [Verticillium dahliae]|nr:hypothetical protein VDGD_21302 [Verticillium dahliae]